MFKDVLEKIDIRLAAIGQEKRTALEKTLDISSFEIAMWQTRKSEAFVAGRISQDVAQYLYRTIGEGGSWPKGTSLATKVLVTELMGKILRVSA